MLRRQLLCTLLYLQFLKDIEGRQCIWSENCELIQSHVQSSLSKNSVSILRKFTVIVVGYSILSVGKCSILAAAYRSNEVETGKDYLKLLFDNVGN